MNRAGRSVASLAVLAGVLLLGACGSSGAGAHDSASTSPMSFTASTGGAASTTSSPSSAPAGNRPLTATARQGHTVVVVLENHSYADVVGSPSAPYLNSLTHVGTSFSRMRSITHPSQPNYVALLSGSTHGVTGDACPQRLSGDTLPAELTRTHRSFVGYSEGLPSTGSAVCTSGDYARRHAPWTNFAALPASVGRPFSTFPKDYTRLPTVSFVVPNLQHDMHDGTVAAGDAWVRRNLGAYATWARTHHSLLILTWDEDDRSANNMIPTIVVGQGVPVRRDARAVTLYSVLGAVQDRYGLPRIAASRTAPGLGLPRS